MKTAIALVSLLAENVYAQLDRAGNVIDDGGGGPIGPLFAGVAVGSAIGAGIGAIVNSKNEKKISVGGCMVAGGMIGMFVSPLFAIIK